MQLIKLFSVCNTKMSKYQKKGNIQFKAGAQSLSYTDNLLHVSFGHYVFLLSAKLFYRYYTQNGELAKTAWYTLKVRDTFFWKMKNITTHKIQYPTKNTITEYKTMQNEITYMY